MIKISNNFLVCMLVLIFLSIVCGCISPTPTITTTTGTPDNTQTKTLIREHQKHFGLNKSNKAVSRKLSSRQFVKIKKKSGSVLSRFGFIQVDKKYTPPDEFYCDKYRQSAGNFSNYKGSGSIITFAMRNDDKLGFAIVIIDWDNKYQTGFVKKLRKEFFLMLKSHFKPAEVELIKKSVKFIFNKR